VATEEAGIAPEESVDDVLDGPDDNADVEVVGRPDMALLVLSILMAMVGSYSLYPFLVGVLVHAFSGTDLWPVIVTFGAPALQVVAGGLGIANASKPDRAPRWRVGLAIASCVLALAGQLAVIVPVIVAMPAISGVLFFAAIRLGVPGVILPALYLIWAIPGPRRTATRA